MVIQNGPKQARIYPSPTGNWQRLVQPKLHVGRFVLATIWTTLDVIFHFFPHGRPKEVPLQVQHNFLHTKLSSMGWRMGLLDKQKASWSRWNTQLIQLVYICSLGKGFDWPQWIVGWIPWPEQSKGLYNIGIFNPHRLHIWYLKWNGPWIRVHWGD